MPRPHRPIGISGIREINIAKRLISHAEFTSLIDASVNRIPADDGMRHASGS